MEQDRLICEHISVSRKQTWNECQQKYKFRYHLKMIPEGPEQPYFTYGKVVHKIAEVFVQEQGQRTIDEIASDVLAGRIEYQEGLGKPSLGREYMSKLPSHIRNIKEITEKIGFDGETEWQFKFDLQPPDNHIITGFIDRLIVRGEKYFILDYKTTKKGGWRKNANTIKKDLQLRCYARVVQKKFGAKAENINCALYYLEGGDLVSSKFSEESLIAAEQEIHDTYKHIISTHPDDVYGMVGNHCHRCDYLQVCPSRKLI